MTTLQAVLMAVCVAAALLGAGCAIWAMNRADVAGETAHALACDLRSQMGLTDGRSREAVRLATDVEAALADHIAGLQPPTPKKAAPRKAAAPRKVTR